MILKSATKVCTGQHYDLTLEADGSRQETISSIHLSFLDEPISNDELQTVIRVWAKYHKSRGVGLANLIGKAIFEDIA